MTHVAYPITQYFRTVDDFFCSVLLSGTLWNWTPCSMTPSGPQLVKSDLSLFLLLEVFNLWKIEQEIQQSEDDTLKWHKNNF